MSLISEQSAQIASELTTLIASANVTSDNILLDISAMKARVIELMDENAQLQLEVAQLNETLANIGTPAEIVQIFSPVKTEQENLNTKLNTIEQGQ